MLALAVSVGLSSIAIGTILSTASAHRPGGHRAAGDQQDGRGHARRRVSGVAATLLGILFAYDSDYWVPSSQGLPVSFFVVSVVFLLYLLSGLPTVRRRRGRRREPVRSRTGPSVVGGQPAMARRGART